MRVLPHGNVGDDVIKKKNGFYIPRLTPGSLGGPNPDPASKFVITLLLPLRAILRPPTADPAATEDPLLLRQLQPMLPCVIVLAPPCATAMRLSWLPSFTSMIDLHDHGQLNCDALAALLAAGVGVARTASLDSFT